MNYFDIIIIGSGMSGLYSSYNIKKYYSKTSFLVLEKHISGKEFKETLEKYKKNWIGGRTSNEMFYGTEIVTGAGIGRKKKDKLLYKLLHHFNLSTPEYTVNPQKSNLIDGVNINEIVKHLKKEYPKYKNKQLTFKEFGIDVLGQEEYKKFIISAGYTDYENEDVLELKTMRVVGKLFMCHGEN